MTPEKYIFEIHHVTNISQLIYLFLSKFKIIMNVQTEDKSDRTIYIYVYKGRFFFKEGTTP